MRLPVVEVESAVFLPQLDGEDSIEHIHIRYLNVTSVEVVPRRIPLWRAPSEMVRLPRSAQGCPAGTQNGVRLGQHRQFHPSVDERGTACDEVFAQHPTYATLVDAQEHEVEVVQFGQALIADVGRMRMDSFVHPAVDRGEVFDLLHFDGDVINRRGAGGAEGAVLFKLVSIEQMNFTHGRFGHQVEDITAGTPKADNSHAEMRELRRRGRDADTGRGRVPVIEDLLGVELDYGFEHVGRRLRLDDLGLRGDQREIVTDLGRMCQRKVRLPHGLAGEAVVHGKALPELASAFSAVERPDWLAVGVAGNFTREPDLVVAWFAQGADVTRQIGDHDASRHLPVRVDVGHLMDQQVPLHHLDVQTLLLKGLNVGIKNDWSW